MVNTDNEHHHQLNIEKRQETSSLFICPKKHFVRKNGWLEIARARKKAVSNRKETDGYVRYFSLCGKEAVDILLFDREGIIRADRRGYPDVCFCDFSANAPKEFAEIKEALGKTRGFNKRFEDLANDTDFEELIQKIPFDIVNLDFCGSCFPSYDEPDSRTLQAIEKIINLQSNVSFDLFVTFRARRSDNNVEAIDMLRESMNSNITDFNDIEVTYDKYINKPLDQILNNDYAIFLLLTIPKIILGFSNNFHLSGRCLRRYLYKRLKYENRRLKFIYKIVKFLFSFDPVQGTNGNFLSRSRVGINTTHNYCRAIKNYLSENPINVDTLLKHRNSFKSQLIDEQKELIRNQKIFSID